MAKATLPACSGSWITGPVDTSISGTPSRSRRKITEVFVSPVFRPESSSSVTCSIGTSTPSTVMEPLSAMTAVRWNPVVFDPSMTTFRMT